MNLLVCHPRRVLLKVPWTDGKFPSTIGKLPLRRKFLIDFNVLIENQTLDWRSFDVYWKTCRAACATRETERMGFGKNSHKLEHQSVNNI